MASWGLPDMVYETSEAKNLVYKYKDQGYDPGVPKGTQDFPEYANCETIFTLKNKSIFAWNHSCESK